MRDDWRDDDIEIADAGTRRSPAMLESFKRHLAALKTPPRGATLAVLKLWHELRFGKQQQ
jgi:hypothetical protein